MLIGITGVLVTEEPIQGRYKKPSGPKIFEAVRRKQNLAEKVFQLDFGFGAGVAIFHDDRRIERDAPLFARTRFHGARTGDDDSFFRNDERLIGSGAVNGFPHQIVDGRGAVQDCAAARERRAS